MTLDEFIESKKFLTLKNYDEETVEGYSYATDTYPAPEHGANKFSRSHSDYCEEHHWITKIDKRGFAKGVDATQYHLILCNEDYLDNDLSQLEKKLYEFIYGSLGSKDY